MKNGATALENNLAVPQKLNIELLYDPGVPLLSKWPREIKTYNTKICVRPCSQKRYSQQGKSGNNPNIH